MNTQFDDLIRNALGARLQAYAPYSRFAVGAAVQCKSAAVFIGSNIENISYGLTICAERIAIGSAVAAGQREFVAIAVVADTIEPIVPCGACRQFLAEFSPDLIIVSATVEGDRKVESLSHLLPDLKRGILKNRSEEHTSELQSRFDLVCRLLLEKKKIITIMNGFFAFFERPWNMRSIGIGIYITWHVAVS